MDGLDPRGEVDSSILEVEGGLPLRGRDELHSPVVAVYLFQSDEQGQGVGLHVADTQVVMGNQAHLLVVVARGIGRNIPIWLGLFGGQRGIALDRGLLEGNAGFWGILEGLSSAGSHN